MSENKIITYEYKDLTVKRGLESLYADSLPHFGWALEGSTSSIQGPNHVTLKFKRDRRIKNKAELTRLQRQFESCVKELDNLEMSKLIGASTAAYIIGAVGTAFMAGSVWAYLANMLPLCIIFAIPGFVGWIVPYLVFRNISTKKAEAVAPLIDQQYDAIYAACEKAVQLVD